VTDQRVHKRRARRAGPRVRRGTAASLVVLAVPLILGFLVMTGTFRQAEDIHTWEFVLQDAAGRPVSSADFADRHMLVYFGYTSCPDVCPATLAAVAETLDLLPARVRAELRVIFISVDPERDAGARLAGYVELFHPDILGLTGSPDAVRRAAEAYGVVYRKVGLGGQARFYALEHTSAVFLITPAQRLELLLSSDLEPRVMAERIAGRIDAWHATP